MSLVSIEPNNFINRLREDINTMLRSNRWPSFLDEESTIATSEWMPAVDIKEEKNQFVIRADIPGVDPKDIEVSMENGTLSIQGERKSEGKEEKNGYRRTECSYGFFHRRFSLPDTADSEKITAKGKHGVLEIKIGKKEGSKPRLINVQS